MIDFKNNELIDPRNNQRMPIIKWEVWFKTALGFYTDLPAAAAVSNDVLIPVPVAIGETYYEPV